MQVAKTSGTDWIRAFREHRASKLQLMTVLPFSNSHGLAVLIRKLPCTEETRSPQTKLLDEGVNRYLRMTIGTLIAQVQMFSPLLDAEQLKPGSHIRHKLCSLHKRKSYCIQTAAGDLRRQRKKEFVDSFRRQKLSEECGPTFVENPLYTMLRGKQSQDLQRGDRSSLCIKNVYLKRG